MYGMTLPEFVDYSNYIEIQNSFDLAIHKDKEHEMNNQKGSRNGK